MPESIGLDQRLSSWKEYSTLFFSFLLGSLEVSYGWVGPFGPFESSLYTVIKMRAI